MLPSSRFSIPSDYNEIWLIGLRIDPDRENCDFFTILFSGDIDVPLTIDNYIVFFDEIDFLSKTIELEVPEIFNDLNTSEIELVDLAQTLYLISVEDIDNSATIVDSLNIIIDLVKASGFTMTNASKSILFEVADYFTFNKKISDFFDNSNMSRTEVIDTILWCDGAIVSKSKFLRN